MSFNLGVWRPNGVPAERAEAYFLSLARRPLDDWTPSADLQEFVDAATRRFSCDEPDAGDAATGGEADAAETGGEDGGPWSARPLVGADEVLLAIAWPVAGVVAPAVLDLAKSRGLVCFDPQSAVLYEPSALTPVSLVLSDGKTIPSPTRRLIERHLRRLSA